ncbi:HEAT repeat-containing protein [Actinokineospora alba]|uniref:HEAT repeat-containing protein n=1 Tax=Actinokineospora alba TaxID=504798 RepID=A0A1H0NKX4_9PSEU|nr:HEAT repeat domain-containing protein [Actinokineospora alba]TDP68756.1 HEAT repeat protein [Actinokineospora alba]SDH86006.1 HEAT repeat-containing protein [Actinokineospora alba]SDO93291.1 HEAT repeat-containing protein [Actinokineospora alba]
MCGRTGTTTREQPHDIYSDLIDIGKQGRRDLADQVVPYLTSDTDFLREAAVRTLVFHLRLPEHKPTAIRLLTEDPDEGVRSAAAMGLGHFAAQDRDLLQRLLGVALNVGEDERVRDAAFIAALVATGVVARGEVPMGSTTPGFDARADWALLDGKLREAGIPVPPRIAARAARPLSRWARGREFPFGESIGQFVIIDQLGGTPDRGRYRAESPEHPVLISLGTKQTETTPTLLDRLAFDIEGVAPLLHIGDLDAGNGMVCTGLVELEPEGAPVGELDVGSAARVGLQVAAILRRAHAEGITLGGLRPELIYVDGDRVTGIVPRCEPFLATASWPCYGVPPAFEHFFVAPEQLNGDPAGAAADVFALTAVLADRVGGHPFTGAGTTNAIAIMVGERMPWTGEPDLGALIDAGLEPDPSRRIGLDELVARLEPLADRNPESAVIEWKRTGDGEFPYRATWRGKDFVIRVNDFPAEPLYTLLVGDEELIDLEDWPRRWVRPGTQ